MSGPGRRRVTARMLSLCALLLVLLGVSVTTAVTMTLDISLSTVPYAMVGTAIVWQRPRSRIGWVLLVFAVLWSATFFGTELALRADSPDLVVWAAWLAEWTWFPALVAVFVVLPIIFPTGSASTTGWAVVMWGALSVSALFVVGSSVQGRFSPDDTLIVPNPWQLLNIPDVEVLLVPTVIPLLLLGPIAAVVRFRRSRGTEREQLRWFMYAAVSCGAMFAANNLLDALAGERGRAVVEVAFVVALSLPPVGIWVAITRHRLYDIDRLISRTVSYGALTALLAGLYTVAVFVLGAVIPLEGDLPIAGATLLVAGLFNPLRRRVQGVVDRRFNRARFNAIRLVERFSHRLRAEEDMAGIGEELRRAILVTMQPRSMSLWLRELASPAAAAETDARPGGPPVTLPERRAATKDGVPKRRNT